MTTTRGLLALAALVAVGLGLVLVAIAGADRVDARDGETARAGKTITIKGNGRNLRFDGPKTVTAGAPLRIVNSTRPNRVGPHTITFAQRKLLPTTPRQMNRCFSPGRICLKAAIAHELDPESGIVNRQLVEAGKDGWDRPFTKRRKGDSWYTETFGEDFSQRVKAKAGKTLWFICAVHPNMQGKIKVVR